MPKYKWTISGETEFTVNEERAADNEITPEALIELSIEDDMYGFLEFVVEEDGYDVNVERID